MSQVKSSVSGNMFAVHNQEWFGEESVDKVADWLEECDDISKEDSVIDLGSGNGMMCIELVDTMLKQYAGESKPDILNTLPGSNSSVPVAVPMCDRISNAERKRGFLHLTGVDYSDLAVTLAKSVAKSEGFEDIEFMTGDLITEQRPNPCTCLTRTYKVVLDKGTYDAISLMPEDSLAARRRYLQTVKEVMGAESLFSITSCNWTKEQLLDFFKEDFKLEAQIPFPTFQFGGQTGSKVTSLLFRLKS